MRVWVGTSSTVARRVTITCPDDVDDAERGAGRTAARLAETLGVAGDALCVGGRLLEDTHRLGHPPLLDGVSVRLVERGLWRPAGRSVASAATEIAVIGGPDAGRSHPLSAGTHTVGRAGADLVIADPTLSRLHLRIEVSPAGVTVEDLGSENGTLLDGRPIDSPVVVGPGSMLRIGQSTLTVRPARVLPATTAPRGDGTLALSRAAAAMPELPRIRVDVPPAPEPPARRGVPWVAALLPVPVALLLAWFLGPYLLLFALMSPVMVLGNVVADRFGARRRYAEETRRHALALERCRQRIASALAAERIWRETALPDLAAIARAALTPGTGLWAREVGTPPRLVVRLGRGCARSGVVLGERGDGAGEMTVGERVGGDGLDSVGASAGVEGLGCDASGRLAIDDAALGLDLCATGSLVIEGPGAVPVLDAVLGQLLVLYSPADLRVLTDREPWWEVPHVQGGSATQLLREVEPLLGIGEDGDRGSDDPPPWTVLAVSGTDLSSADLDLVSVLCREGPRRRVIVLVTGASITAARARLVTSRTGPARLSGLPSQAADIAGGALIVDGVGATWVGRVSAALTPLRDPADSRAQLPQAIVLADVLGEGSGAGRGPRVDASAIATRWEAADDGAWVTLGMGAQGTHRFDLAAAGPHVLVGGTTGSGKSELLRTIVVSLAAEHPPEDLAVVLVDYKGGSAFAGLEALPHIVGAVTDLDPALTRRALTSLRAEVHRRERLFAESGATDIRGYRATARLAASTLPPLARLVIVVDEFRALADELPEFVDGLVRLAAVGRSLGIHLVLATQRPAGVVTADMRANLNLRIALRMRDRTDSQDVIESDAAALLDPNVPGRALIRAGGQAIETVQTATVGAAQHAHALRIELSWSDGSATRRDFEVATGPAPVSLVESIAEAATSSGRKAPRSPWLPALGETLRWSTAHPPTAWALVDEPADQRQRLLILDVASLEPTAIAGSVGSGRTTTALAIAAAALADSAQPHVYAVADTGGRLADLTGAPSFGGVVDRADPARVAWFTDRLAAEVRDRRTDPRNHRLLVVIDGWEVLADACDRLDHGALTDRLLAVLREGHAVGVRSLVTGDRSVLSGRVGRAFPERFLLRPSSDTDLALAGVRPAHAPTHWPPGRMIRVEDGTELQVLLRDAGGPRPTPPSMATQSAGASSSAPSGAAAASSAPTRSCTPSSQPWRVVDLPSHVPLGAVPPSDGASLPIAADGDHGGWCEVGQPGRRRLLITGSAASGRSTALATIALQACRAGRTVCVVADEHSDLARLTTGGTPFVRGSGRGAAAAHFSSGDSRLHRLTWHQDEELIDLRRVHSDLVVVADDVDRHLEASAVPVLEQIADLVERDGGLIAVSGDAAVVGLRPRGLGPAVARGRVTIVLGAPSPMDADLTGTRLPRVTQVAPGRGWLVADRRVIPIQLAIPVSGDTSTVPSRP